MTLPRLLLGALLVLVACVGAATVVVVVRAAQQPPPLVRGPGSEALVAPAPEVRASAVLAEWDAARAEAWAAGDVRRLGDLYTSDSVAGRRDRAMLRSWLARGLVVRGLTTQVLALEEVHRRAGTWVLRVTDRVAAGTAVGRSTSQSLPQDTATSTTVTMRRVSGQWLVSSVRLNH